MNNVIDLNKYKQKKKLEQDLARGRKPLGVSHKEGTIAPMNMDKILKLTIALATLEHLAKVQKEQNYEKKD